MPTLQFLYFDRDEIISSSRYMVKPKPTSVDAKVSLTEFNGWFLEKLNYHLGTEELGWSDRSSNITYCEIVHRFYYRCLSDGYFDALYTHLPVSLVIWNTDSHRDFVPDSPRK